MRIRLHRTIAANAVILALVVAACGSAAPSVNPSPEPTPTATPTPTPKPTPDVAALFVERFGAVSSGVMSMNGSMTVGDVKLTFSGSQTFNDPDYSDSVLTGVAGTSTNVQHVKVGGARYVKTGSGPWLVDTSAAGSSDLGAELRKAAETAAVSGTEIRDGTSVHKLVPAGTVDFDPAALGVTGDGIADVVTTLVFYATADGTPTEITIDLTWTQPAGEARVVGALNFTFGFDKLGSKPPVVRPLHVWQVFTSDRWAYSVAYPDDFDVSPETEYDFFVGTGEEYAGLGRFKKGSATLNTATSAEISAIKKTFKTTTVTNEATTVGGEKARLLTATGTDAAKTKVVFYEVVVVHGKYVFYLFWVSPQGNESADLATFQQLLASFAFR